MAKKLLIVESPAKAGTIKKYLGKDYDVTASMGHIIDLPKSQLGVDVEHDFEPKYITIRGKGDLLTKLKKTAKASDTVYLATDPDREGEAISWHLARALGISEDAACRVTFNEITKNAVKASIKKPRKIDMDLVNAQQARRILDRVVGYKISPILWEKVKRGLSAGRVQSVATRMICDREDEIENFDPKEYWTVEALLKHGKKEFSAKYYGENGKETELSCKDDALKVKNDVKELTVKSVKIGKALKNPPPPFTTSTLQQDASRKLGFATAKTMQTAQTLYEGVNIGGKYGSIGLITYMRTDSLRISVEAQREAIAYLNANYGKQYVKPRQYKTGKNAQDAHEAIRPTSVNILPDAIRDKLTNDQYKLYKLIWERFCASQMAESVSETQLAVLESGTHTFRATGTKLIFKGFMSVYTEGSDEAHDKDKALPDIKKGEVTEISKLDAIQHFTKPPARYTEAALVHALEENGIGRPSTYAPTITTIVSRGYVRRVKKQLIPTELGRITTDIMKKHFEEIVDVEFTAGMEKQLDEVEDGKLSWIAVLSDFYPEFESNLKSAQKAIEKIKIKDEESDVVCDKCGRKMVYKIGKFGKFLACPGYPECKNTMSLRTEAGVKCPKCGGEILVKKTRKGRNYYGCENNPKCDFMVWDKPLKKEVCPDCGGILLERKGKNAKTYCINEKCGYEKKPERKSK